MSSVLVKTKDHNLKKTHDPIESTQNYIERRKDPEEESYSKSISVHFYLTWRICVSFYKAHSSRQTISKNLCYNLDKKPIKKFFITIPKKQSKLWLWVLWLCSLHKICVVERTTCRKEMDWKNWNRSREKDKLINMNSNNTKAGSDTCLVNEVFCIYYQKPLNNTCEFICSKVVG